jgi:hypothetical protein
MATDNIVKIINAAGFVAVPMLPALAVLNWHFTWEGRSTRTIFIAVAGILSAILYSYFVWTKPSPGLILIPRGSGCDVTTRPKLFSL